MAGFTPVTSMLRIAQPDPIGVDQLRRKNALMDAQLGIDRQNAMVGLRNADINARRLDAAQAAAAEEQRQSDLKWAVGAASQLAAAPDDASFARLADQVAASPEAQRIGLRRETMTRQDAADFVRQAQAAAGVAKPPETFGAPQNMLLGGRPSIAQVGSAGTVRPVAGAAPYNAPRSGMSVTTPDGTQISIGGDGSYSPTKLGQPTRNKLEEDFNKAQGNAMAIAGIMSKWNPEYSSLAGKWDAYKARTKDFLNLASPQEKQYLADFSAWRGDVSANLSAYLNQLSGAAISPAEEQRLRAGMPNDQDSPTEFYAKAIASIKRLSLVQARAAYLLSHPELKLDSVGIDQMSRIMLDQANQLAISYMRTGITPDEAKARATAETRKNFGLQ